MHKPNNKIGKSSVINSLLGQKVARSVSYPQFLVHVCLLVFCVLSLTLYGRVEVARLALVWSQNSEMQSSLRTPRTRLKYSS